MLALGCTFSHPLHVGEDEFDHPDQGNTFVIELAQDPNAVAQCVRAGLVRVFPNPTSGTITLSLEHVPIDGLFIVRDALGREVVRQHIHGHRTTLALSSSGVYMAELWEQGVRLTAQRVVVE